MLRVIVLWLLWGVVAILAGVIGGLFAEWAIWHARYRVFHRELDMRHDPQWTAEFQRAARRLDRGDFS